MIQPYLILASMAGIGAILWHRHYVMTHEAVIQKTWEREQRKKDGRLHESALRRRLSLEDTHQTIQEKLTQVTVFLRKAETHFAREEWRETAQYLVQALAVDENNPKANRLLGLTYLHQADWRRAELVYLTLVEIEPREASGWSNLGLALYHQKKYDEARQAYEHALKLDAKKSSRWMSLGQVCMDTHDYPAATRAFAEAHRLDRRNVDTLVALGESTAKQGDNKKAIAHYDAALALTPYDQDIQARRATLLQEKT